MAFCSPPQTKPTIRFLHFLIHKTYRQWSLHSRGIETVNCFRLLHSSQKIVILGPKVESSELSLSLDFELYNLICQFIYLFAYIVKSYAKYTVNEKEKKEKRKKHTVYVMAK